MTYTTDFIRQAREIAAQHMSESLRECYIASLYDHIDHVFLHSDMTQAEYDKLCTDVARILP